MRIGLLICCVGLWFGCRNDRAVAQNCITNLKIIEGAKATWALENHKLSNDIPTWNELLNPRGVLMQVPACPAGGKYTLGKVGELAECTNPAHQQDWKRLTTVLKKQAQAVLETTLLKKAVLDDLGLHGRSAKNHGAYFIRVETDDLPFLRTFFEGNLPRVELSADKREAFTNVVQKDGMVVDRVTNEPGTLFGFDKVQITGDRAEVDVSECVGAFAITVHTYKLDRNGVWEVREHSTKGVS